MEKNKKIILLVGAGLVSYFILRHTKSAAKLLNTILKPFNCGCYTTGGSDFSMYKNHISCNKKVLCESDASKIYEDGQCKQKLVDTPTYTVKEDIIISGKSFKSGDIIHGEIGTNYDGRTTVTVVNEYGFPVDGKSIEIPIENLTRN